MTKPPRWVPGVWKGEPDGMQPLTEQEWFDILHKNRTEIEADERKERERNQTPNTTEPL